MLLNLDFKLSEFNPLLHRQTRSHAFEIWEVDKTWDKK